MDSLFGFIGKDYAMLAADANAARSILVFKQDEDKIIPLSKKMAMATSGAQGDRVSFSEYIHKNVVLNELRNGFPMSCVATANFVRGEIAGNLRRRPYNVNALLGGFEEGKGSCLYVVVFVGGLYTTIVCGSFGRRCLPLCQPFLHHSVARNISWRRYYVDYFGTMHKMNFGCHGACAAGCGRTLPARLRDCPFLRSTAYTLSLRSPPLASPPCLFVRDVTLRRSARLTHSPGHCAAFCLSLFDRHWEPDMSLEEGKELMSKCFQELKVRYLINMPKFVVKVVDADGVRQITLGGGEEDDEAEESAAAGGEDDAAAGGGGAAAAEAAAGEENAN